MNGMAKPLVIIGSGGIGGTLAALLTQSSVPFSLLCSPKSYPLIEKNGMTYRNPEGEEFNFSPRLIQKVETESLIIVATKAFQIDAAFTQVDCSKEHSIIPLLNGISHYDILKRKLPQSKLIHATIGKIQAYKNEKNKIIHKSGSIEVSLPLGSRKELSLFDDLPIGINWVEDIQQLVWSKLCRLNALALATARHGNLKNILNNESWKSELYQMLNEAYQLARHEGIVSNHERDKKIIEGLSPDFIASMALDIKNGNISELQWITSPLIDKSKSSQIPIPTIENYYHALRRTP